MYSIFIYASKLIQISGFFSWFHKKKKKIVSFDGILDKSSDLTRYQIDIVFINNSNYWCSWYYLNANWVFYRPLLKLLIQSIVYNNHHDQF